MFSRIATTSFQSVLFLFTFAAPDRLPAAAHPAAPPTPPGIAWRVDGQWQDTAGRAIHKGDAVAAGALVRPAETEGPHSLTVLLPDGQRVVNECFTVEDCSRGFRIPSLNAAPAPFNADMLRMIGDVLSHTAVPNPSTRRDVHATPPARDEAVVPIHTGSVAGPVADEATVSLGGLLASLPAGRYTYTLLSLPGTVPRRFMQPLKKTSTDVTFSVPGPGLYEVEVADSLNTSRVNVMFAAVPPADTSLRTDFEHARTVLKAWDEQYYGWPVHELLRAYLRARIAPPAKGPAAAGTPSVAQ